MSFASQAQSGHGRSASGSYGAGDFSNIGYPHIDDLRAAASKEINATAFNSVCALIRGHFRSSIGY